MTFSWKELVFHGLLAKVGEPSLVKDLLKMVMKERWLFLEEEARAFHSEYVSPVVNIYRFGMDCDFDGVDGGGPSVLPGPLARVIGVCQLRWQSASRYKNVKKELISSWKERIPEERRQAVTRHKESKLLRWRGATGDEDIKELGQQYPSIEQSIKWYGEIHEGRYYLFWDKTLSSPIEDCATRRRQSKASLMSGFDINIIDGEGLKKNISDTWVYAYEQWIKNPGGWGARQFEFTMVHERGKKEKMHLDDMFSKIN